MLGIDKPTKMWAKIKRIEEEGIPVPVANSGLSFSDVRQPACDVYSLGILLWQLDSREIPFQVNRLLPEPHFFACSKFT
jgi:hypothetical protein